MDSDLLKFDPAGLIPAIVQHHRTRRVLMMGYMNREALARTLEGPHVWFWSRSRQELWEKGATSGNYLVRTGVTADCDGDTLLVLADPAGPTCHTGATSCFSNHLTGPETVAGAEILEEVAAVIAQRNRDRPEGSYTAKLLKGGMDKIAKKVGEEAAEVIIAGKNGVPSEIAWEVADLWYHCLVLMAATDVPLTAVYEELVKRRR